ncbi:ATP-binding cassette domain-containing protein, partial [Mycoplasma tauri]
FYKLFYILTKKQKENIFKQLDNLGILRKCFTRVDELSGGEAQRVEIAKILVNNSKLILADEPTSSLDEQTSVEVFKLLKEISVNNNVTIIAIMHNLDLSLELFDKIIVVSNKKMQMYNKGKITKDEILKQIVLDA